MGDSGSQVLGFMLAALGLAASWKVAGTTVATLLLPMLDARRADPRHDARDDRPACSKGGRSRRAAATTRRTGSCASASPRSTPSLLLALIATGARRTSLAYNVLDDQRLALVGVLVTFVLLVQFASFLADVERRAPGSETPGLEETFAVHWRRLVEVRRRLRPDHRRVRRRVPAAVRLAGDDDAAAHRAA